MSSFEWWYWWWSCATMGAMVMLLLSGYTALLFVRCLHTRFVLKLHNFWNGPTENICSDLWFSTAHIKSKINQYAIGRDQCSMRFHALALKLLNANCTSLSQQRELITHTRTHTRSLARTHTRAYMYIHISIYVVHSNMYKFTVIPRCVHNISIDSIDTDEVVQHIRG